VPLVLCGLDVFIVNNKAQLRSLNFECLTVSLSNFLAQTVR